MAVLHIEYTMNKIPERARTSQDEPERDLVAVLI